MQFQIAKRTRNVFQLHEVYKACCFKPHLRKNPVAKTSKELVCFFCRSARFAVLQVFFRGRRKWPQASRIRRPWGVRVGPYKRVSNRWSLVGVYGRGRGARGCTKKNQEMVVLCRKSKGSALWGRLRGRTCPRSGQRELQGGLLDTCWELRGVFLKPFWVKNSVLGVPVGSGVRFRS